MYLSRNKIQKFPFKGAFYKYDVDDSKSPLKQGEEEEILVLEVDCDIQESSKTDVSNTVVASFNVYFPFDKSVGIPITRGMTFKGSLYGLEIDGEVIGIFPTQLGYCSVYLRDKDIKKNG